MRKVTLCFLLRENEICLAMKKRGFGAGKYNGVGGKLDEGETVEQAALREVQEEIGVAVSIKDLEHAGTVTFTFTTKPDWDQEVHIFLIRKWNGDPIETEEMAPEWFALHEIPYEKMWIDDKHWLPTVLEGKKIQAHCALSEDGSEIENFTLTVF